MSTTNNAMRIMLLILTLVLSANVQAIKMNEVEYTRHEPHSDPEQIKSPLLSFVYDVPYLSACGVFPPLHILNEILKEGGSQGGMSPGATWKSFSITQEEYDELWELIARTEPSTVKDKARYTQVKFKRDRELENINDRFKWMKKTCDKHRDSFFKEQNKYQGM